MASRQNNIHERVKRSEIPIRAFNSELGYEQLYCSINTSKDFGHIVVSAINKPLEPIDTEFLLTLKKYINEQIKKDAFIQNAHGFNYEYFIRDLLDHKIAADRSSITHMNYVKDDFNGNNYCIVIEIARSQETINARHVRNMLESRIPYLKTVIYNGQLIAIITIPTNQLLPQEYIDTMQKLCQENGLYAGMSNCFQDILNIEEYYNQALRSIELGTCKEHSPNLFSYQNYYLEHMLNSFTLNESSWTFCHPKMQFLLDYDKEHHSELAYTLYMYLTHERNLAATSEAMDMHRTSLVYRFKKINALIGEDFDDYRERMYLILSYEMNRPSA